MVLNKAQILGYVGEDPAIRYMPDGTPTVTLSVATTETWKDKATGEKKSRAEWHRVVFFRKLAEIVATHIKKGSRLLVEGSLRTRSWKDREDVTRYTTEIIAREMLMLGDANKTDKADGAVPMPADFSSELPPDSSNPFEDEDEPFWGKGSDESFD